MYFCIDMKCFFASVECAERGLNPLVTPLVVADNNRGKGTICLAVSPFLKSIGVKNRCRLYEIPPHIKYITAKPRMSKYIDYAVAIHKIFLDYISSEDIHTYSIDEAFLHVGPYLHIYNGPKDLAYRILGRISSDLGLVGACGVGENLFLAKLALDLYSKYQSDYYFELTKDIFFSQVWKTKDLEAIWQIGKGISRRLNLLNLYTLRDVALSDKKILQKEFGVIGDDLYEHAWGNDSTEIADIRAYQPQNKSFSRHQILFKDYSKKEALTPLLEMLYLLCLELFNDGMLAKNWHLYLGFNDKTSSFKKSFSLGYYTADYFAVKEELKIYYEQVCQTKLIRQLGISASGLVSRAKHQVGLFEPNDEKTTALYESILEIWQKYGKNKALIGTALLEESTIIERNKQIGGHNSD